mmetsp:Transcript_4319/g.10990  ORF Transcript_4319/g.10990 Transcript_4319/m.10990 type:complete len:443 (+) Transcript_4319:78-1406(+)
MMPMAVTALAVMVVPGVVDAKARAPLYGISSNPSVAQLVKVNVATGNQTNVGHGARNELSAQGLACIDQPRGIYYVLDFNDTSRAPQLIGFSLKAPRGSLVIDITLDLSELMFVGVGQSVGVDPLSGRVIISGHDSTVQGHHIFWIDPHGAKPSKPTTIAKIAAPAVYLLGGSSAVDWNNKVFYAIMVLPPKGGDVGAAGWPKVYNYSQMDKVWLRPHGGVQRSPSALHRAAGAADPPPPPPPPPPFSVNLVGVAFGEGATGAWERIEWPAGKSVGTLAYDEKKQELVGFGEMQNADGTYSKTLESIKATPTKYDFRTIGEVKGFAGEMGPITTVDSGARVHYSMLSAPPKPWETSDGCAATGFPCKANTSCCRMPPAGPACFNVPSCKDLQSAPDINAPFFLAQLDLDTAEVASRTPPLCSIAKSNCPWSLEADEVQHVDG